jgi:hypothetical protein
MTALRLALADVLDTIPSLRVYRYIPPTVNPPAAAIKTATCEPNADFNDRARYVFEVWFYVSGTDWERGQELIDEYVDPQSVVGLGAAIDAGIAVGTVPPHTVYLGFNQPAQAVDSGGVQVIGQPVNVEMVA